MNERDVWGRPPDGGDGSDSREPSRGAVASAIAASNPLRRQVGIVLVAALVVAGIVAAVSRRDGGSTADDGDAATATTTTTTAGVTTTTVAIDAVAATVIFDDGATVDVSRRQVEILTELILDHDEFLSLSFDNPSENRVRSRVTRNLVMVEIARHRSPGEVSTEVLDLVRDEQVNQVLFELTLLKDDQAATKAREIIEDMAPYVDILAETIARQGRTAGIDEMLAGATILVDSDIGVWDPVAIDVFG